MYSETEHRGDEGYIGEDLFSGNEELELRCIAIDKAVREGYFSLSEALPVYEVSEPQYLAYYLIRKNNTTDKQQQLIKALHILFDLYQPAKSEFDKEGQKILNELQALAH